MYRKCKFAYMHIYLYKPSCKVIPPLRDLAAQPTPAERTRIMGMLTESCSTGCLFLHGPLEGPMKSSSVRSL